MSIPTASIADRATAHLGEAGPHDTCWSNGPERWVEELGLPGLDTGSVSEARRRAKAGQAGWRYHDGTAGMARGHIADWSPAALGGPGEAHVCVVDAVEGELWRGIGSGTPSGKVARQPASGGFNPKSVLLGYFIAPTGTATGAVKVQPSNPAAEYVVKRGDALSLIADAHHTTVKALLRANPPAKGGRSADFHIARASHIEVGQRIRLP